MKSVKIINYFCIAITALCIIVSITWLTVTLMLPPQGNGAHKPVTLLPDTGTVASPNGQPAAPSQSTASLPTEIGTTADGVSLPENGTTKLLTNSDRLAPLTFTTQAEGFYFYVIISDWTTNKPVQTLFLHSGHAVESRVPVGSFRIKYATGKVWRGEKLLFGDETEFFVVDKRFDFVRTRNQIQGYTIELIMQVGGNLSVKQISKAEW